VTGQARIGWVVVALGMAYLIFIGGEPAGIQLSQLRVISVLVIAAAVIVWFSLAVRDARWWPKSVFFPAIVACVVSVGISTAFSRSPRVSVEYLAYTVLVGALYLLLVQLMARPAFRLRIVTLGSFSAYAIALLFLGAVLVIWAQFWILLGGFATPPLRPAFETLVFGNPSVVLALSVLLGAVAIGWLIERPRPNRLVTIGSIVLFAATALVTGTRGGWLAIGVGVVGAVVAFVYLRGPRSLATSMRTSLTGRGAVSILALGVMGAATITILGPAILQRLGGGETNRPVFYRIAATMFGESPIVGVGPGIWAAQRVTYTLPGDQDEYVPHAHNLYLQGLAEMGLVGAAAGVLAAGTLLWLLRDALRDGGGSRQRWGIVAVATTSYMAAHHLVEFYANAPTILFAYALPIAYLDATAERRPTLSRIAMLPGARRVGHLVQATAVAAAIAVALLVEVPGLIHADAVASANRGDWSQARRAADSAVQLDPEMPIYRLTAGLAAARAGDYHTAAENFRVIAEAGDLPQAWLNLADAYLQIGDSQARDALVRALRVGYQQPAVTVPATVVALALHDPELATIAAEDALIASPMLAGDPWWHADPEREAVFNQAFSRAVASADPQVTWQLAIFKGDLRGAGVIAESLPDDIRDEAQLVVAAWQGDEGAFRSLDDACLAEPYGSFIGWCALVARRQGDASAAERFDRIGRTIRTSGDLRAVLRIVERPTELAVAGNRALLYGIDAYRRFTAWDMLSPSLPHIEED
jgi:O-antigen ligase